MNCHIMDQDLVTITRTGLQYLPRTGEFIYCKNKDDVCKKYIVLEVTHDLVYREIEIKVK